MREAGIPNPPTLHNGEALYRRCFTPWRICIVCIASRIFAGHRIFAAFDGDTDDTK
jgi:hypothetical protein